MVDELPEIDGLIVHVDAEQSEIRRIWDKRTVKNLKDGSDIPICKNVKLMEDSHGSTNKI